VQLARPGLDQIHRPAHDLVALLEDLQHGLERGLEVQDT
jgi:hypothetical protein